MRIVVALGGNALLRRGEAVSAENQRRNMALAAAALTPLALAHDLVVTHGSGPQVGLLALQSSGAYAGGAYPLDVLDAEVEGIIGYAIEQELVNRLRSRRRCATLLTQIEVDARDPAFERPTKPIGLYYGPEEAKRLGQARAWTFAEDGGRFRRVVPSPRPRRILETDVIALLVEKGVLVICAGGGGIPVVRRPGGDYVGIEAVIDKDHASALLARELRADAFLMLTDVDAVWSHWGKPGSRRIRRISPDAILGYAFAAGSMGPKVEAACDYVVSCDGVAGIGRLQDAEAILAGEAGTLVSRDARETLWWAGTIDDTRR